VNKSLRNYYKFRDKRLPEMLAYRRTPRGRAVHLVGGAKRRALKLNIPFSLSVEFVARAITNGHCEATGVPFFMGNGRHPFSPSLDRKDQTKGYTDDNVQVTLWMYNAAKGTGTHADVTRMAEAIVRGV
jgi:hypothetical protein